MRRSCTGNLEYGRIPYPDLEHNDCGIRTRLKNTPTKRFDSPRGYMGESDIICFVCGDYTDNFEQPRCECCCDIRCEICEDPTPPEDICGDPDDRRICFDCWRERYFNCPLCNENYDRDCEFLITISMGSGRCAHETWCDNCAAHHAVMCNECEEYTDRTETVDVHGEGNEEWCYDCLSSSTIINCENCGIKVIQKINGEEVFYCDGCAEHVHDKEEAAS